MTAVVVVIVSIPLSNALKLLISGPDIPPPAMVVVDEGVVRPVKAIHVFNDGTIGITTGRKKNNVKVEFPRIMIKSFVISYYSKFASIF
jgi:hypothetical protein